jgi:hypothetical protein
MKDVIPTPTFDDALHTLWCWNDRFNEVGAPFHLVVFESEYSQVCSELLVEHGLLSLVEQRPKSKSFHYELTEKGKDMLRFMDL